MARVSAVAGSLLLNLEDARSHGLRDRSVHRRDRIATDHIHCATSSTEMWSGSRVISFPEITLGTPRHNVWGSWLLIAAAVFTAPRVVEAQPASTSAGLMRSTGDSVPEAVAIDVDHALLREL